MSSIPHFWHRWSWAFHIGWALVLAIFLSSTYINDIKANTADIAFIKGQNLDVRLAVQEQTAKDIRDDVKDIKATNGAIFNRLNQLADRK